MRNDLCLFSLMEDEVNVQDIVLIGGKLRLNRLAYDGQLWKWRKRYCYLLSDGSFFYYETIPDTSAFHVGSVLPKTLGKPRGVIPIGECDVWSSWETDIAS